MRWTRSGCLAGFGAGTSILDQLIGLIPGTAGGLGGLGGLGSIFGDLFGLVGSPTGVGSGSPALPGIGSIPILGGLLGGGGTSILGGLIPGLDASKIVSGVFPMDMISGCSTFSTTFPVCQAYSAGLGWTPAATKPTSKTCSAVSSPVSHR